MDLWIHLRTFDCTFLHFPKNSQIRWTEKPVKNKQLWQSLNIISKAHNIDWKWVKGHSGHLENERADQLANIAIDSASYYTPKRNILLH